MAEPDGLVLYCSPIDYRNMRVRTELQPAFDIAIATQWDGSPDALVPFTDCLDAHRAAYGPTTEQSTNMQDELARLDAGLLRPKDLAYPAISDPESKPVADGRSAIKSLAEYVSQLERSQAETRSAVMAAMGQSDLPSPVDVTGITTPWIRQLFEDHERETSRQLAAVRAELAGRGR